MALNFNRMMELLENKVDPLHIDNSLYRAAADILKGHSCPIPVSGKWADIFDEFVRKVYGDLIERDRRVYGYWRIQSVEIKVDPAAGKIYYSEIRDNGASIDSIVANHATVRHLAWLVRSYLVPQVPYDYEVRGRLENLAAAWHAGQSTIVQVKLKPTKIIAVNWR